MREAYVLTLAAGCTATASLWPVDDLQWSCSLTDPAGVECWQQGPWANRDRALSAATLEAERRWGRIVRCEPKERVDEIATLRLIAQIAREDRALRESARADNVMQLVGKLNELENRMNAALDTLEGIAPAAVVLPVAEDQTLREALGEALSVMERVLHSSVGRDDLEYGIRYAREALGIG